MATCATKILFLCPKCDKCFKSLSGLSKHLSKCGVVEERSISCPKCEKCFQSRSGMWKHSRKCGVVKKKKKERSINSCLKCGKSFQSQSGLWKHSRKCGVVEESAIISCQETGCLFKCHNLYVLREHLGAQHNLQLECETKVFKSTEEFNQWKREYERSTDTWFVKHQSSRTLNDGSSVQYLYCNRSGTFRSVSTNKKKLKSQGSSKIGKHCTAQLKVTSRSDGKVEVRIHHTHYGHDFPLGHLRLSSEDRSELATMLFQGWSLQKILDNIRNSVGDKFFRKHLLEKRDLYNIKKSLGIDSVQRHTEDSMSVDAYVKELVSEATFTECKDTVLIYKKQGDSNATFPPALNTVQFPVDDVQLGIQTEFQRKMLQRFGNNIICVDCTHKTNGCDFKLVTVMVIDEYGEGIPVAWLLSNKEDYETLEFFFQQMKAQLHTSIQPKVFMSDKAPQFFSAWTSAFAPATPPKKLLCMWHVLKNWQDESAHFISDKVEAAVVYKSLVALAQEADEGLFDLALQKTVSDLEDKDATKRFAKYFTNEWCTIKEEWALYNRVGYGINTNMFVEVLHKNSGKVKRSLDKCLYMLLQYSRDLTMSRLQKIEKGKITWKISAVHKGHRQAETLKNHNLVEKSEELSWLVKSEQSIKGDTNDSDGILHKVEQLQHGCLEKQCQLKCDSCQACIHTFRCSCLDAMVKATVCKHMHLVAMFREQQEVQAPDELDELDDAEAGMEGITDEIAVDKAFLLSVLKKDNNIEANKLKASLLEKIVSLHGKVYTTDDMSILQQIDRQITSIQHTS